MVLCTCIRIEVCNRDRGTLPPAISGWALLPEADAPNVPCSATAAAWGCSINFNRLRDYVFVATQLRWALRGESYVMTAT
jgi:hypothetical protein